MTRPPHERLNHVNNFIENLSGFFLQSRFKNVTIFFSFISIILHYIVNIFFFNNFKYRIKYKPYRKADNQTNESTNAWSNCSSYNLINLLPFTYHQNTIVLCRFKINKFFVFCATFVACQFNLNPGVSVVYFFKSKIMKFF